MHIKCSIMTVMLQCARLPFLFLTQTTHLIATLLNRTTTTTKKVQSLILEKRLSPIVKLLIQMEQCCFHPGIGTVNQMFTKPEQQWSSWRFVFLHLQRLTAIYPWRHFYGEC